MLAKPVFLALFWVLLYLGLVCAPLALLLVGDVPRGGGMGWDFAMALGFAGLAVMGLQFALTARLRRATAPFGIDILYYFHRLAALVGFALVGAHAAIAQFVYPDATGPAHPLQAAGHMSAGRVALIVFAVVIAASLWRKPLGIRYERWRMSHAVLATLALALAIVHVEGVGYYTGEPWKRTLWIVYTLSWIGLIGYVRVVKPWRMSGRPWRVVEVRPERGSATTLVLEPEGHAGLRFAPGQFAWLTLRASPFRFQEHPFSFSGSAERSGRLEFTIKALGDFTSEVATVRPGERAWVDGPYGVFSPDRFARARGFVFIAAGAGIAPVMSMLRTFRDRGERRPLTLIHASRDPDSVIFREEIDALGRELDLRIHTVIEHAPRDWTGERGRIDAAMLARLLPLAGPDCGCEYFVCGPKPVSELVQDALHARGVPLGRVHFELFDMV